MVVLPSEDCLISANLSWLISLRLASLVRRHVIFAWVGGLVFIGCGRTSGPSVVVYTSQDQVYAEPILREFQRSTGIRVDAVYDSEAVKTVGLANRLLAEKGHPRCDVFWNNEELRTRQLAAQGVFRENGPWKGVGYRSRRIVINTNHVKPEAGPKSLLELADEKWLGKVALAYPLFGTTATHFLALRQHWGENRWSQWCRALENNRPFVVDGNSVVVKMVGRGEAWVGLTDSDDIAAGQREGLPIAAMPLFAESMLIPNTVAIVRGAPNPDYAQQLSDYLTGAEVVNRLVTAQALEGSDATTARENLLSPDWSKLLAELPEATEQLKQIFLR